MFKFLAGGKSSSGKSGRSVMIMAVLLIIVSSVPAAAGVLLAQRFGLVWSGRIFLAPGDISVYLSYITQVSDGSWLVVNLFAPETGVPVLNFVWLIAGFISKLFSLSSIASFQALRVLFIPVLALTVYWSADFFLNRRAERLWATALALFSSGWGIFVAPFIGSPAMVEGNYNWPIDLWVAESNMFLSSLHSPHFLAGWILIIVSMTCLAKSFVESRLDYAAWAGLAALVLFEFHPFHAPTLYAVALGSVIVLTLTGRKVRPLLVYLITFGTLSAPAVFYHWWLLQPGRNEASALSGNLNYTPELFFVVIGFGALVPLAVVGAMIWRRRGATNRPLQSRLLILLTWITVQSLVIYAPVIFQRRFIQGLEFPLVLLSAVAAAAVFSPSTWRRFGIRRLHPIVGAVIFGALLIPSSFYALANSLSLMAKNETSIFYHSPDEVEAMKWLHDNTSDDDLVLASFSSGNSIPGHSGVNVFVGHWMATPNAEQRDRESIRFFGPSKDDVWRQRFLEQNEITLVYVGPVERRLGAYLVGKDFLDSVYETPGVVIYRVK